jgi:hypothetical protein
MKLLFTTILLPAPLNPILALHTSEHYSSIS